MLHYQYRKNWNRTSKNAVYYFAYICNAKLKRWEHYFRLCHLPCTFAMAVLGVAPPAKKGIRIGLVVSIAFIAFIFSGLSYWENSHDSPKEPEISISETPTLKIDDKNYIVSISIQGDNNNYAYNVSCNAWAFVKIKDTLFKGYGSPATNYAVLKRGEPNTPIFTIPQYWRQDLDTAYIVASFQFRDASRNAQPPLIKVYRVINSSTIRDCFGAEYDKLKNAYNESGLLAEYN